MDSETDQPKLSAEEMYNRVIVMEQYTGWATEYKACIHPATPTSNQLGSKIHNVWRLYKNPSEMVIKSVEMAFTHRNRLGVFGVFVGEALSAIWILSEGFPPAS